MSKSSTDIFDIDAHLAKLSGEQNYMNSLKQITGDIHDVNMDYWRPLNEQNCKCNDNIYKLLVYIANVHTKRDAQKYKLIAQTKDAFEKEYQKMALTEKALYKDKKGRYHINHDYYPEYLVKSEWFNQLRALEKAVNDFIADILDKNYMKDIDNDFNKYVATTNVAVSAVFAKHPEFVDLKKIYGCEVGGREYAQILDSFVKIKAYASIIINNYMAPMYDVRKKIMNSYDRLEKIFKTKGAKQMLGTQNVDTDEVVSVLEKFIIAKYRKEITGNAEHYTKLFMSIVGNDDVSAMSGPRLLELMDSIDLNLINSNKNAYKFANGAKEMIRKLVTGEAISAEESIKEIKELFEEGERGARVEEVDEEPENDIL